MHAIRFAMIAIVSAAVAGPALAKDPVPSEDTVFEVYGEAGDWTVYVDTALGTCLIERAFGDSAVQMGLTKNQKHSYVGVFTKADVDIKNRQKVEIDVDGAIFEGRARGIKSKKLVGDYKGAYVLVDDVNLRTAISEGKNMIVFPKKTFAFQVDLTGTKAAIEEGRKCNLAQTS